MTTRPVTPLSAVAPGGGAQPESQSRSQASPLPFYPGNRSFRSLGFRQRYHQSDGERILSNPADEQLRGIARAVRLLWQILRDGVPGRLVHYSFKPGILVGPGLYALGALLFIAGSMTTMFWPFLVAYFILDRLNPATAAERGAMGAEQLRSVTASDLAVVHTPYATIGLSQYGHTGRIRYATPSGRHHRPGDG